MSLLRLDVIVSTPSLILRCCYVALRDSFASFRPTSFCTGSGRGGAPESGFQRALICTVGDEEP